MATQNTESGSRGDVVG